MPNSALYTSRPWTQRVALSLGISVALCVFIAAGLAMAVPDMPSFGRNLLYSLSIGMSVALLSIAIDLGTPWPPPLRRWRLVVTLVVATPLGYAIGSALAHALDGGAPQAAAALHIGGHPAGLLSTALASLVVGAIGLNQSRIDGALAARANAQRLAAEAELRALRAQLDPHMLFNTLAHLRSLVEEEPPLALEMIDHLMPYLRDTLDGARSETSTLQIEFDRLRHYLQLMALRIGPRLSWDLQLPAALRETALPSMLLQPLVENAVRHGVAAQPGPGRVVVTARREAGDLVVTVRNSGRLASAAAARSGYGLHHVLERVRALHGEAASCEVTEAPGPEVCATLRMPA